MLLWCMASLLSDHEYPWVDGCSKQMQAICHNIIVPTISLKLHVGLCGPAYVEPVITFWADQE